MNYSIRQELLADRILDNLVRKRKETGDEIYLTNNRVDAIWHLRTLPELKTDEAAALLEDYCDPNLTLVARYKHLRSEINRVVSRLSVNEGAKI
jgi:hypothetical protein